MKTPFIIENSGTYLLKSKIDDRYYPGSSRHLLKQIGHKGRKAEHFNMLKRNEHHCPYLQHFYNKYGKNSLEFIILQTNIPEDQLFIEEQKLLDYARDSEPEKCFTKNFRADVIEMTQEVKDKISNTVKEKYKNGYVNPLTGKPLTEEHKQKLRENHARPMLGKKHTLEACKKISDSKIGEKNPMFGKPCSEERKRKIGEANSKVDHSYCAKPVKQINKVTGEIIKIFKSARDAAKEVGLKSSCSIGDVLKNRVKTAAGFKWEYV